MPAAIKMLPEHYNRLKSAVFKFLEANPSVDVSNPPERVRWGIYWTSGGAFSNAPEYHYLDDSNIDTALRHILAEYRDSSADKVDIASDARWREKQLRKRVKRTVKKSPSGMGGLR